jgi:hypothetical protein
VHRPMLGRARGTATAMCSGDATCRMVSTGLRLPERWVPARRGLPQWASLRRHVGKSALR